MTEKVKKEVKAKELLVEIKERIDDDIRMVNQNGRDKFRYARPQKTTTPIIGLNTIEKGNAHKNDPI